MTTATLELAIAITGYSQLIQLPITYVLATHVLDLRREIEAMKTLNAQILRVLGAAAVVLLVGLGLLVALHPADIHQTSLGRALALFLSCFWLGRFAIQLAYGRTWPREPKRLVWHYVLLFIFIAQGTSYALIRFASASGHDLAALNQLFGPTP